MRRQIGPDIATARLTVLSLDSVRLKLLYIANAEMYVSFPRTTSHLVPLTIRDINHSSDVMIYQASYIRGIELESSLPPAPHRRAHEARRE